MRHIALVAALAGVLVAGCDTAALSRLALRGTVVTPDRVIPDGLVTIEAGRIVAVTDYQPADVTTVETDGIILPGLIDLHNHPLWAALPRWSPGGAFRNRDEWTRAPVYVSSYVEPEQALSRTVGCEVSAYAEIRAIAGGVTAMRGSPLTRCSSGLLRNLESDGQLSHADGSLASLIDVDNLSAGEAARLAERLRDGSAKRLFVHVGEGRADDPVPHQEFETLVDRRLLTDRTVIIHGTGFGDAEFDLMQAAGASLVWSPRSTIELYGETTSIMMAVDRGIPTALAPDWSVTGSDNLLGELRMASAWSRENLGGALDDRTLVQMATEVAARIAGLETHIGSVAPGRLADLLVIRRVDSDAYRAVVTARPGDVRLVMVGGQAVYGHTDLMRRLRGSWDGEALEVCGETMRIDTTADRASLLDYRYRLSQIHKRLSVALASIRDGVSPAPVVECGS